MTRLTYQRVNVIRLTYQRGKLTRLTYQRVKETRLTYQRVKVYYIYSDELASIETVQTLYSVSLFPNGFEAAVL